MVGYESTQPEDGSGKQKGLTMSPTPITFSDIVNRLHTAAADLSSIAKALGPLVEALETATPQDAVTAWWQVSQAYDAMDTARKEVYALQDMMDKQVVPTVLDKAGLDLVRIPALKRSFYPVPKYTASMLDKAKGYEWLKGNGLGELITETVNAGTLAKALRQIVADRAIDPPPEIFEVKSYNTMGSSKYTPKEKA